MPPPLPRQFIARRSLPRTFTNALSPRPCGATASSQIRQASSIPEGDPNITDPNMNGGYVNPPRVKRQFRDPYTNWWDPVERRNFGEPVHEDNDIIGMFSPEPYTHMPPRKAGFHLLTFLGALGLLAAVVSKYYPDTPAIPVGFPDGLDAELGGENAIHARKNGEQEDRFKLEA